MNLKKLYLFATVLPIIIGLITCLSILLFFRFLPSKLPLFYSLAWGEQQLATNTQFFIIPASLILISIFNLAVAWYLHLAQTFFKKILLFGTLVSTLILTITFIKIVLIFF